MDRVVSGEWKLKSQMRGKISQLMWGVTGGHFCWVRSPSPQARVRSRKVSVHSLFSLGWQKLCLVNG